MSYIRKFMEQSSYYFAGYILIMLAGLISFPIWTRMLSREEYGMFSLISTAIMLGVALSKGGPQHSALRYHSDFKEKVIDLDISYYYSTILGSSVLISGTVILCLMVAVKMFFRDFLGESLYELLPLVLLLIFIGSITNVLTMFIRSDNRGRLYNVFTISIRYGQLFLALAVFLYFRRNLQGLLSGYAIAEAMVLVILFSIFLNKIRIRSVSLSFLKEAMKYGFPLIWMEISNLMLNVSDRFIIKYYMSYESVGLYSAGFNVSNIAQSFLTSPLRLAIVPMYLHIWNKAGEDDTRNFLSRTTDYYFMLGIPIAIGLSWFSGEVITFMASAKYQESAVVIPYLIFGQILYGASIMFSAGLRIHKKTLVLMLISFFAAIMNILLNIVLIPKYGMLGAAYATISSYVVMMIMMIRSSHNYLRIRVNVERMARYAALSFLIVAGLSYIPSAGTQVLLTKMAAGALFYLAGIVILNVEIRRYAFSLIKRMAA